jgi:hypothetical protein
MSAVALARQLLIAAAAQAFADQPQAALDAMSAR